MSDADDRQRNRERLEEIYRVERGTFLRQITKAGIVLAEAEDVLQDVFARASSRIEALEAVQNLSSWIATAVRNRLVDLWRRGRTRSEAGLVDLSEELFEEIATEVGLDPLDEFVRNELSDTIVEAVHALPEKDREIILSQVFDGESFREISERTGVPVETLSARKRAAIRRLGKALREWITES